MRTIHWQIEMGLNGCNMSGTFEVEDDATDEDIEEIAKESALDCISWTWHEAEKEEKA